MPEIVFDYGAIRARLDQLEREATGPARILVVEDSPVTGELLTELFEYEATSLARPTTDSRRWQR